MVRTFGAMLRRRWRVVAIVTIACLLIGAMWAAAQTPRYRSTVTLARVPASLPDTGSGFPDLASLLRSPEVAAQVEAVTGLPVSAIDLSLRRSGNGLTIITTASDAALAQRAARGFGDALTSTTVRIGAEPATGFELRSPAQLSAEPFSPDLRTTALVTGVFGVALGTAAAFVVERLRGPTTTSAGRRQSPPATAPLSAVEPETAIDPGLAWFLELSRAAAFDDDHVHAPEPDHGRHDAGRGARGGPARLGPVATGMPAADRPRIVAPPPLSGSAPTTEPAAATAAAAAPASPAPSPSPWPSADLPDVRPAIAIASHRPTSLLPVADLPQRPPRGSPASVAPSSLPSTPRAFSALVGDAASPQHPSGRSFSFSALALGEPG